MDNERTCRAWCSRFAIGNQPHAYIGFILFLLMSFRTAQSYKNYVSGQQAFYQIQTRVRSFVHMFLDVMPRYDMSKEHRARILAHLIAFPYALTAELRRDRRFSMLNHPLRLVLLSSHFSLITDSDRSCFLFTFLRCNRKRNQNWTDCSQRMTLIGSGLQHQGHCSFWKP